MSCLYIFVRETNVFTIVIYTSGLQLYKKYVLIVRGQTLFILYFCTTNFIIVYYGFCSWWSLIEKSWGIQQKYPRVLPFYSNFDQVATL